MAVIVGNGEPFGVEDGMEVEGPAIVLEVVDHLLTVGIAGYGGGEFLIRQMGETFARVEVQPLVVFMPGAPYPTSFFDDRVIDALFLQGGGRGQSGDAG